MKILNNNSRLRNMRTTLKSLCFTALLLCGVQYANGQCAGITLSCNTNLQISLNDAANGCEFVVTPDVILENPTFPDHDYLIEIEDKDGNVVPNATLTYAEVGEEVSIKITYIPCGIACWGTANVEDKKAPVLDCGSGNVASGTTSMNFSTNVSWQDADQGIVVDQILSTPASIPPYATIADVDLRLFLDHSQVGDLTIDLISPTGTSVNIIDGACGNESNISALFNDGGLAFNCDGYDDIVNDHETCQSYYLTNSTINGNIRPNGSLADFNNECANGDWRLVVRDNAALNGGCLHSFQISINWQDASANGIFTRECDDDYSPGTGAGNVPFPIVMECDPNYITYHEDAVQPMTCVGKYRQTIFRTWIVTDSDGNSTSCTQQIRLLGGDLDDVVFPSDLTFDCDDNAVKLNNFPNPEVLENNGFSGLPSNTECPNILFDYSDGLINLCGVGYKILRTWTAVDWCTGQQIFGNQVIKVEDTDAPITSCPAEATVPADMNCALPPDPVNTISKYIKADGHCEAVYENVEAPIMITECSAYTWTVAYLLADPDGGPPPTNSPYETTNVVITGYDGDQPRFNITNLPYGPTWLRYTLTDACGLSTDCYTEIFVYDATPPTAICEGVTALTLFSDECLKVYATSLDDGSWDGCSTNLQFEISRNGSSFFESLDFCCSDAGTNEVYLRVTDECGNSTVCTGQVVVEDAVAPYITSCVPNANVDCEESTHPNNTGWLTSANVGGNCTNPQITYSDGPFQGANCNTGHFVRTWIVTSANGQSKTCTQTISVTSNDPLSLSDITWPSPTVTIPGCVGGQNLDPDVIGSRPVVNNNSICIDVAISFDDETITGSGSNYCLQVRRTWKITDWCLYNPNLPVQYYSFEQILSVSGGDAPVFQSCGTYTGENTGQCEGFVDLTQVATDDCSAVLSYSWQLDLYSNGTIDHSGTGYNINGTYPSGNHKATFFAVDDCGNEGMTMCNIVINDNKPPTPICIAEVVWGLDSNGEATIWASDFNLKSEDTCDPESALIFAFDAAGTQTSLSYDCSDVPNGIGVEIPLNMYVIDTDGNSEFCLVTLILQDNNDACTDQSNAMGRIMGEVTDELGTEVDEVEVNLINMTSNNADIDMTDASGDYAFNSVAFYDEYTIDPSRHTDPMNGVSTLDLVLIQKHILNLQTLDSPYKLIAADINNSGNISAMDLIELRKLILGIYTEYPNNDPFVFVAESYEFADPADPWGYQNEIDISALFVDETEADFIAVKVGDVNNTAVVNLQGTTVNRNASQLKLQVEELDKGSQSAIKLLVEDELDVAGFQFELEVPKGFNITSLSAQNLEFNSSHYTVLANGNLRVSYNTSSTKKVDSELLTINYESALSLPLSEVVRIAPMGVNAELYDNDLVVYDLDLEIREDVNETVQFELIQNNPNPFSDETTIAFKSKVGEDYTFNVFSLEGRVVYSQNGITNANETIISIDRTNVLDSGIYYYQVNIGEYSETKKMVFMK